VKNGIGTGDHSNTLVIVFIANIKVFFHAPKQAAYQRVNIATT